MSTRALLGFFLVRLVVPAWIMTGAIFKLVEGKASLLPSNIFEIGVKQMGIPGYPLLATLPLGLMALEPLQRAEPA